MMEQPVAKAADILRTAWLMGKFQGVKAATGPTGCLSTCCCTLMLRGGTMRPYTRRPSSANHSMMSAADMASTLASARGLPCSWVSSSAICGARSRISAAALRMMALRSLAGTSRHNSKPFWAACAARSRSGMPACARRPISVPVAGLNTARVRPPSASHHWPLMKSWVLG